MILEINKLSVSYGQKVILKDVSLSMKEKEAIIILGSNGSGKSTLVKSIAGIVESSGSVIIDGQDISNLSISEKAKFCAYIPPKLEGYDLQISVREFALMGRFAHKERWLNYQAQDYKKVDAILEELNLADLKDQKLNTLSSGEQQLTLIASALAQESPLLIFDEPTAHLDPKNIVHFVKLFRELQKNYSLILITHDIQLAQALKLPILFIEDQKAKLYRKNFFQVETLLKHYGVDFTKHDHLGLYFD